MNETAYHRARKQMGTQAGAVLRAKILGVLQTLLLLSLSLVIALLLVFMTTRGEGKLSREVLATLPSWAESRVSGDLMGVPYLADAGLLPFVAANLEEGSKDQQGAAKLLLALMNNVPTLHNNLGALTTLLALGLAIFIAWIGVAQARRRALAIAACEAAASLRRQLHRQMYRLGQSSLPTEGTGPVVNLFSREVNDIRDSLSAELDQRWTTPVFIVGVFVFAMVVSWSSWLFVASLGGLVWLAARALRHSSQERSTVASRDLALDYYLLQEDLSLLRTVRIHGMENVDKLRFEEHLHRHKEGDVQRIVIEGESRTRLILLLGSAGTLAIAMLVHSGIVRATSPVVAIVILAALFSLYIPCTRWLAMRTLRKQAERSASAIYEYLRREPELQQPVGAHFVPPLRKKITFENVTLQNARGRTILEGFSVDIPAGSRVALMSLDEESCYAIACLIPRLIDPKSGRVRFDGLDLRDSTLESIRAQVAGVLQADLVFSDTIAANIGLGDDSYDLPRIVEAAKAAHAHKFIQELPHGYETRIGPMGTYLPPDQQYRIGLARAFLHDPSIVILEEPTIPLGEDVKDLIDDSVMRLSTGRTVLILPHRLSTIRSCDLVLTIQNGRLESAGAPRDLQGSSKLFRHLQYVQFNQFATGEIEAGQMNA